MTGIPRIYAGRRKRMLSRLIANGIAQGVAAAAFALLLRGLLDNGATAVPAGMFAGLALSVLATGGLRWLERVDAERLGLSYVRDLRLTLFDHLSRVAPERLRRVRHGHLSLRFVGDMSALRLWASRGLARVWVAGAMLLAVLSALSLLDWRFTVVVALVFIAGAGVMALGARALDASVRRARKRQGRFAASANEQLLRLPMIQAYAQRDAERAAVIERSRRLWNASISLAKSSGLMIAATAVTTGLATIAVIAIAYAEARHTRGTLLAAILLVSLLATPLQRLGRVVELWRSARVAEEKLASVLALGPRTKNVQDAIPLPKGRGQIEFRQFALPGLCAPFDGLVRPGARVLLQSETPGAASAVLWSVLRLTEGSHGGIRIDGLDIAVATLGSLRRAAALISPELPPIRGRMIDNLRYRTPEAPDAAVERVLDVCALRESVARLPHGLQTQLGDGARLLDPAERIRLCWARALLGQPRILLVEDAEAQMQGGNRNAFLAMLAGFDGTVLMCARDEDGWPPGFAIWRLCAWVDAGGAPAPKNPRALSVAVSGEPKRCA